MFQQLVCPGTVVSCLYGEFTKPHNYVYNTTTNNIHYNYFIITPTFVDGNVCASCTNDRVTN